ncbi:MAG: TRAP transporter TatT component family protein [Myxococcota bacterium]
MSRLTSILLLAVLSSSGCKSLAIGAVADALSGTGGAFAEDDDPELVEAAIPFGLKTMESVIVQTPEHRGLLLALCSGFVQYGEAFVHMPAERVQTADFDRAQAMNLRARRLFKRAMGYGLRGLSVGHQGFEGQLKNDPKAALAALEPEDAGLLYWTAAAWGLSISTSKNDPDLVADLPIVQEMAERLLALDPSFGEGATYELLLSLETSKPGGDLKRAKELFDQALALSKGERAGPYVSYAEAVDVKQQNVKEFKALLGKALAIDPDANKSQRLANILMQRRARWLLDRTSDLFLDADDSGEASPQSQEQ